ncbi:MAG: hypothetical protein KF789_02950 [Bdellovibrionaceae bacterium]|nr:hypothetical protein [Pseudobdellovibrionaceae bacterium]
MEKIKERLERSPEVSSEDAARWLGITTRSLLSYLKAKQIEGVKVGDDWFVKSQSVLRLRPVGIPLPEVILPELENPLSRHQHEKQNKKNGSAWQFKKGLRRSPRRLNCFVLLQESLGLLKSLKSEMSEDIFQFFKSEILALGDELGAGYYSFGLSKRKLYARARIRAGRMVSRSLLVDSPQGFSMSLCQTVEAVTYLCRKMERKEAALVKTKTNPEGA